jgi:pimeloyl-ACP methyl ester carboxylesterase
VSGTMLRRALLVVTASALVLGGCSFPDSVADGSDDATPAPKASAPPAGTTDPATQQQFSTFYEQRVDWTDCDDDLQCARVRVPLDWARPAGDTISLAIARYPAQDKAIGSLLVNPGGPGVSGISYAKAAPQAFGQAVLRNYDVVGFDPRGIGGSQPVTCLPDSQLDAYTAQDATPDDAAELATAVSETRRFAAACRQNSGPILDHVDTLSTVKDMDVIRSALGDDTLSYHGASYGTYLGAWYAQTFPWRVGRMVLDGAIDPSISAQTYVAGQAEGFSRALRAYVTDCQSESRCPLRGSVQEGLNQLAGMVASADTTPLRTSSRPLTQQLMTTGIAQALYADQLWPALTIALTRAMSGDGTELLALADTYLERSPKGKYGQTISANPAIFCLDVPETRSPAQIKVDADELQRRFPPLGGVIGWGALTCAEWPVKAVMPREKVTAPGAAPILVLGTTEDPATPYEWAQGLAAQLSSGRLLTWEASVHTAYHQGSDCVDKAVETYLLTGRAPAENSRCK